MYTTDQINEIKKNSNVLSCSKSSVSFTTDFKVSAIHKYYDEGYSPTMIFEEAGFNIETLGKANPGRALRRWKKVYNTLGEEGLIKERRGSSKGGGRPKTKFKSDNERIAYLEAKVDYLTAKNDFLAQLRGLRKE